MSKSFGEQLSESLGKAQRPKFRKAFDAIRGIADGIRQAVLGGQSGGFEVEVVPGHTTNLGQQFRVRLQLPARKWEETLFRAYIPADGFPVALDLDGEEPVMCNDVPALERAVLDFLRKPEIDSRLSIVRESLQTPPP